MLLTHIAAATSNHLKVTKLFIPKLHTLGSA
jgi:hypothetical protein